MAKRLAAAVLLLLLPVLLVSCGNGWDPEAERASVPGFAPALEPDTFETPEDPAASPESTPEEESASYEPTGSDRLVDSILETLAELEETMDELESETE